MCRPVVGVALRLHALVACGGWHVGKLSGLCVRYWYRNHLLHVITVQYPIQPIVHCYRDHMVILPLPLYEVTIVRI